MILLTLLISVVVPAMCRKNFTGHKLLAVIPKTDEQLIYLQGLLENSTIDAWSFPTGLNNEMKIHVSPNAERKLEHKLLSKNMNFYVVTDDIQEWIDKERKENPPDDALHMRQGDFQLDTYHTFDAIIAHLDSVASRYSELVEIKQIGSTYEGNPLKGLKIGTPGANKPALWIDSGIHAREWVAPATSLYIIEQLVKGYDTDPEIQELVDAFDWYIFPVMNPDGYKYTWSTNRMWRKNRAPSLTMNPFCKGTDPNRNFDASFGGSGTSNNPCSEIYRGRSAFSEAESQAIRDGVLSLGENLKAYITLHAYSQLYMSPYGTTKDLPPDYEDLMNVMKAATTAIQEVHGETYKYGTIANVIYPCAGSSVDWVYTGAKVKYSFAVELRDTGRQGFMLSNSQILPTAEENFTGIKAMVKIIQAEQK